jgi:hypothetical protein
VVGAAAPVGAVVNNRDGGFRLLEALIIAWRMVWCMIERQGSVLAEITWGGVQGWSSSWVELEASTEPTRAWVEPVLKLA